MGQAFDCACRSLHDIGQLDTTVKEFIAKRIVELARDSERDPNKLCEHALQTLGFFPGVDVPPKWTSDRLRFQDMMVALYNRQGPCENQGIHIPGPENGYKRGQRNVS